MRVHWFILLLNDLSNIYQPLPPQYLIFEYLPAWGLINLGIDPLRLRYYTRYFRQCTVISFSLIKYGNHMLSIIVDRFTQHKSLFFTTIMTTKPALRGEIGSHSGTLTTGTFDENLFFFLKNTYHDSKQSFSNFAKNPPPLAISHE